MSPLRSSNPTRRMLARVRDIMAEEGTAQDRLNEIVSIIATEMEADVCSVYIRRAGDVLELFATKGLSPDAVHSTRLRVGEGLIGDIAAHARPLAISDAQKHPSFAYRPETGEDIYHSLMGVPILRGGNVIGTLAVQMTEHYDFADEEIEALQTVAMVVAEMVVSGGELLSHDELHPDDGATSLPLRMRGMRLAGGLGMGAAVLHQPEIKITRFVAENPDAEQERLTEAVGSMRQSIQGMLRDIDAHGQDETRDILETYWMFAQDAGWLKRIREGVSKGLSAEAAVNRVRSQVRVRMGQISDPYLRERLHDFDDLANRLLQHLVNGAGGAGQDEHTLPDHMIVVARSMGPAELLDYDRDRIRGLVLEEGSHLSHVAIIARTLGIPVVGNIRNVTDAVEPGDLIVVDGDSGQAFLRPGDDILETFYASLEMRNKRRDEFEYFRHLPAVTVDGDPVSVNINVGLLSDVQHMDESGADGIGLYRTEVLFMVHPSLPDVETQADLYRQILDLSGKRVVNFRALDAGGDKALPYWREAEEDNPAMGWRAIRVALDRPSILRQQARAMILAAAGRDLRIMFPMIADVSEFFEARRLVNLEMERVVKKGGTPPADLKLGVMLEVPSLAVQLPVLLPHIDFLSIGTNDLMQFLFAADRGNPKLSDRYDHLSPIVLRYLHDILTRAQDSGMQISVCGEMASRPLEAMALIGIGYRSLSIAPPSVGPVKAMIRSLDVGALSAYMEDIIDRPDRTLRAKLRAFALDHGVIF